MKKMLLVLIILSFMGVKCADSDVYFEHNYSEYYEENDTMAIDLANDATLAGRIITDDPEYPDGKPKDADTDGQGKPVDNTGTPYRAVEQADIVGLLGGLLALGNLDPSGLPDAPNPDDPDTQGQYIKALTNWYLDEGLTIGETTPSGTTKISYVKPGQISALMYPPGATIPLISHLENGGVMFQGWVGDSSTVFSAEAEFDIDIADLSVGTNIITYNPSPSLELTGITPNGLAIISCDLIMREAGVSQTTVSLNPAVVETGTFLEISGAQGFYSPSSLQSFTELKLRIRYDPRYVEQP